MVDPEVQTLAHHLVPFGGILRQVSHAHHRQIEVAITKLPILHSFSLPELHHFLGDDPVVRIVVVVHFGLMG